MSLYKSTKCFRGNINKQQLKKEIYKLQFNFEPNCIIDHKISIAIDKAEWMVFKPTNNDNSNKEANEHSETSTYDSDELTCFETLEMPQWLKSKKSKNDYKNKSKLNQCELNIIRFRVSNVLMTAIQSIFSNKRRYLYIGKMPWGNFIKSINETMPNLKLTETDLKIILNKTKKFSEITKIIKKYGKFIKDYDKDKKAEFINKKNILIDKLKENYNQIDEPLKAESDKLNTLINQTYSSILQNNTPDWHDIIEDLLENIKQNDEKPEKNKKVEHTLCITIKKDLLDKLVVASFKYEDVESLKLGLLNTKLEIKNIIKKIEKRYKFYLEGIKLLGILYKLHETNFKQFYKLIERIRVQEQLI